MTKIVAIIVAIGSLLYLHHKLTTKQDSMHFDFNFKDSGEMDFKIDDAGHMRFKMSDVDKLCVLDEEKNL